MGDKNPNKVLKKKKVEPKATVAPTISAEPAKKAKK